jgi:hypothetical protein
MLSQSKILSSVCCILSLVLVIDGFFEWIEWRVEKLTQEEVVHRNAVVYAELKVDQERKHMTGGWKMKVSC